MVIVSECCTTLHESLGLDCAYYEAYLESTESLHLCNLQCNDDSSHPTHSRKLKDLLFIQRHITVKCGWSQCTTGTYLQVCWQPRCSLPVYYIHTAGIFTHCRHWPGMHHTATVPRCHGSMVIVAIPGTIATFLRNLINDHYYQLCYAIMSLLMC